MKKIVMMAVALLCTSTALADCPPLNLSQLDAITAKQGEMHLVFFSSWCSDCREHLQKDPVVKTIYIGSFDMPERAESALRKAGRSQPCYLDDGLTQFFKVKIVPAERVYLKR